MAKNKFPYLVLDEGRWVYLRRPPKDLIERFPPRIKQALGSGDRKVAEERWGAVHNDVEAQIRRVREEVAAANRPEVYADLGDEEAKTLIYRAWWCWVGLRRAETASIDAFPDFALSVLSKLPVNAHLWPASRLRAWFDQLDRQPLTAVFSPTAEAIIRREIPALVPELHGTPGHQHRSCQILCPAT
ncbi:MAG: hypothetical protein AB1918_04695 [Pseudomonadota bacterium]